MINTTCCCVKPNCEYDIAFLITEEKASVNAPIVATPSVSFYIQEFLGFTGETLNSYIAAGPIEGQKENTPLYKEVYESLTGKTFDGREGCCKDPNYYFLDHETIRMSEPKYLGTHFRDEKEVFYEGNPNSNSRYLSSLVKQTLILPEKYKNYDHPGLTLFSTVSNLSKIQQYDPEIRTKSLLKHIFSKFFKQPVDTNKSIYSNYHLTVDDEGIEPIGYYYNAIVEWNSQDIQKRTITPKKQPIITHYYINPLSSGYRRGYIIGRDVCRQSYIDGVQKLTLPNSSGVPINIAGSIELKDINFDRSPDGISFTMFDGTQWYNSNGQYLRENLDLPIWNKIPVYFPPSDIENKHIGYTLSVQYTKNLPVFSGVDEDFLIHYNGLTLGFVNSIAPISYKLNVNQIVNSVKLTKKLINIQEIRGHTLEFKQSQNSNFNKNSFSSDIIGYLRYLNRADMINDQEIERLKTRYYRYKNIYKTWLNTQPSWQSGIQEWGWDSYDIINAYTGITASFYRIEMEAHEYCAVMDYPYRVLYNNCNDYPLNDPKYISDFNYDGPNNKILRRGSPWYYQDYSAAGTQANEADFSLRAVSHWVNKNYYIAPEQEYKPNTEPAVNRRVNQNINDYFHHGIYFDLNKSFQLKKLWETHLSYYWGGFSINDDLEPNINQTEGSENRFIKYVYPVVNVNTSLCSAVSDPKSWSVYFTVHDDVRPNNNYFEQYFWLNGDSYVKSKTLLSKYQENIRLSVKVLRILKDTNPYELQGISYSNTDKKRIKFIDTEFTESEFIKEQDNIDSKNIQSNNYKFLNPPGERENNTCTSGLINDQNLKINENRDTNNVILFEDAIQNNSFYEKQNNSLNFSANLNDNITLAPWSKEADSSHIGYKMFVDVGGITPKIITPVPLYISKTFNQEFLGTGGSWDIYSQFYSYYYTYNNYFSNTTIFDGLGEYDGMNGREINLPLITKYIGEKISGKQIVIPYLKIDRSASDTSIENNINHTFTITGTDANPPYSSFGLSFSHYPLNKNGAAALKSVYNIDINDTSAVNLNPYLLYEPPLISEFSKSGYGLYKQQLYSYIKYKNKKETDLFEAWKDKTINDLQYYKNLAQRSERYSTTSYCESVNCDELIQNLETTTISNKLYFINPICRKNNFNFDVKTEINDLKYIRQYSSLLDNYKVGGADNAELNTVPYLRSRFTPQINNYYDESATPTALTGRLSITNRSNAFYPDFSSGLYYKSTDYTDLQQIISKNIDIGVNSINSKIYPINFKKINVNTETIPLEINLYNNRNFLTYEHGYYYGTFYETNMRYSNWYYYTNRTATELDTRKAIKLIYDANSMNSNYANISLFKKINSNNYYALFSTEEIQQPISQIEGKKKYPSNNILKNYILQKRNGSLSLENNSYCVGYCMARGGELGACERLCTDGLFFVDNFDKNMFYADNFGGLVLDTDTYAFKYDFSATKRPEIAFMLWNTDIEFGQFNNEWLNLRNSYVPLNNSKYKNGWLIKKNQPDQHFIDNLLESIQEKYIEFQYYERFITDTIETVDKLSDADLYCITVGSANSLREVGKNIENTRHFERRLSISGSTNYDPEAHPGNSNLIRSLMYQIPSSQICPWQNVPQGVQLITTVNLTAYWVDVLRTAPNITVIPATNNTLEKIIITNGSLLPGVKRSLYDFNSTGNLQKFDITNTFPIKQTSTGVNILYSRSKNSTTGEMSNSYLKTKITTESNLVADTISWFNTMNSTNRGTLKQQLILNLQTLLEQKREPFVLLEQLFGTISVTQDIINQKNLKKLSKKINLQNYYSVTRLEKIKSNYTDYELPRFLGIDYKKYNKAFGNSQQNYSYLNIFFKLNNWIYFKETDFILYKTSDDYWPNIKSIQLYATNLGKIKTNSINNYPHFLSELIVTQNFSYNEQKNILTNFNTDEEAIKNNTEILDYNFYKNEGYYLDLSKDYEVFLPQLPVSCKYDALPSYEKRTETITEKGSAYPPCPPGTPPGSCPLGYPIQGTPYDVQYVRPKEIVYTNLDIKYDLSGVDPENKLNKFNYNFYDFNLLTFISSSDTPLPLYADQNMWNIGSPPVEIIWNKPNGFVLTALPFNTVKLVLNSSKSVISWITKTFQDGGMRILQKRIKNPVLGFDTRCYDGNCEEWAIPDDTDSGLYDFSIYDGTVRELYPAYFNLIFPYTLQWRGQSYYQQWGDRYGIPLKSKYTIKTNENYSKITATWYGDNGFYSGSLINKISKGSVFNCLMAVKFPTVKITEDYYQSIYRDFNPQNIFNETTSDNRPTLQKIYWSNYHTFNRPKIKVKGIPNTELKLINFDSLFKNKQLINDILYPIYGNFGKK